MKIGAYFSDQNCWSAVLDRKCDFAVNVKKLHVTCKKEQAERLCKKYNLLATELQGPFLGLSNIVFHERVAGDVRKISDLIQKCFDEVENWQVS